MQHDANQRHKLQHRMNREIALPRPDLVEVRKAEREAATRFQHYLRDERNIREWNREREREREREGERERERKLHTLPMSSLL